LSCENVSELRAEKEGTFKKIFSWNLAQKMEKNRAFYILRFAIAENADKSRRTSPLAT
jgi:hypothetical protein